VNVVRVELDVIEFVGDVTVEEVVSSVGESGVVTKKGVLGRIGDVGEVISRRRAVWLVKLTAFMIQ
jgi:hypothetical protein